MALGYSEEQEFAADAWSWEALRRLGTPADAAVSCLRKIDAAGRRARPDGAGAARRPDGALGDLAIALEDHFASHPRADLRCERIEALARAARATPSR